MLIFRAEILRALSNETCRGERQATTSALEDSLREPACKKFALN